MLVKCAAKSADMVPYPCFGGEMAQYYAEQEWERLQESDPWDLASQQFELFDNLVEEAERRKLKLSYERTH